MGDADDRNQKRWEKFRSDPDYHQVVTQVRDLLDAAGLDASTMSKTWGLTVHVDKETFLRVNHADYALFDIRKPHLPLEDRKIALAVLGRGKVRSGLVWNLVFGVTGLITGKKPGFTKLVPGSKVIFTTFKDLPTLLAKPKIRDGIRRHVAARPRHIFATRHNPHSRQIFD